MAGFGGIGNVSPILTSILSQPIQSVAFRPGQVFQGIVQSVEPQTLIRFGTAVLQVEQVEGIQPGQAVSAELVRTDQGLQLRITPGATTPQQTTQSASQSTTQPSVFAPLPDAGQTAARNLPELLVSVLDNLGKLDLLEPAANLIPPQIGRNPEAVRLVLSLLLDRSSGAQESQQIVQIIQQAVDDGALPRADARALVAALRSLIAGAEDEFAPVLRRTAEASQRPIEARLAEAVAKGTVHQLIDSLKDDLASIIRSLRNNDAFNDFLNRSGNHADFSRATDRVLDRFTGAQLINARGTDVPYVFFEMPLPAQAPLRRAHIHVMGEGEGRGQRFDPKNATVVFDVSTTALGDLWITLTASQGMCSCWIRAKNVDTVSVLEANARELTQRLSASGYPRATVQATLWDGDRVRELATMMRRFKGLNVQA